MSGLATLFLLRHGECEHNVAKIVAGRSDTPLTPKGREQALLSGRVLFRLLSDASAVDFVSSPSPRARTTLELMATAAATPIEPRMDERLLENDFGEWTGRPGEQAWAFRDAELERTGADPFTWRWPGGEGRADVATRIRSFLGDVRRDTVVVRLLPSVGLRLDSRREICGTLKRRMPR
jgi:broad specificity phosphatase PhoE